MPTKSSRSARASLKRNPDPHADRTAGQHQHHRFGGPRPLCSDRSAAEPRAERSAHQRHRRRGNRILGTGEPTGHHLHDGRLRAQLRPHRRAQIRSWNANRHGRPTGRPEFSLCPRDRWHRHRRVGPRAFHHGRLHRLVLRQPRQPRGPGPQPRLAHRLLAPDRRTPGHRAGSLRQYHRLRRRVLDRACRGGEPRAGSAARPVPVRDRQRWWRHGCAGSLLAIARLRPCRNRWGRRHNHSDVDWSGPRPASGHVRPARAGLFAGLARRRRRPYPMDGPGHLRSARRRLHDPDRPGR